MKVFFNFFLIVNLICSGSKVYSQPGRVLMDSLARRMNMSLLKESIYLNSDKDIYIAGENLWFNAFVMDRQSFGLAETDKILYLEIMSLNGDTVIWKEMYPVVHGVCAGHAYLPVDLRKGRYLLKAYTGHSFTRDQPYFFATATIQVVKDPREISNNWKEDHDKTLRIDIFPEGGQLVSGVTNTVAFRTESSSVKGKLLKNGVVIQDIETEQEHIGVFQFTPDAQATYSIQYGGQEQQLPAIQKNGVALHLLHNGKDSITFSIAASGWQGNVLLRLQMNGALQMIGAGVLHDNLVMKIPVSSLPAGIAEVSLFDDQFQVLASRLVYVHAGRKMHVRFSGLQDTYGPKGMVTLKITTTDENGKPMPAAVGVRVYDRLFGDARRNRDLTNFYYLTSHLRDTLINPDHYFDSSHPLSLDTLLLTKQVVQYNLSERNLKEDMTVLPDSLLCTAVAIHGADKKRTNLSLLFFNYDKSVNRVGMTDEKGQFFLRQEELSVGQRFFIKYFSDKEYALLVPRPFDTIMAIESKRKPVYFLNERRLLPGDGGSGPNMLQYGNMLKEVVVSSKGRDFNDPYLGFLDSIAKFEANTDFVGACGWLNCPACGSGKKPVEGVVYSELKDNKKTLVSGHPFSFGADDYTKEAYHYPKYTEEELLKKFKMVITKGFWQHAPFYHPDYEKEDTRMSDTRNVLYWNPLVVTNEHGEATIRFYCSDIKSSFVGVAEGVAGNGYVGTGTFDFSVR
ncbi:hypothetical protein [[Flexibacter] sp. ATCC 35208]|uniref:hypothetical protein n=1 Tax=[Flexibacter] sp. ATCC 35208 TaxID=1936242 RepID=UPI0009CB8EFE|nr:hypothetical protein [[Flexibacter] sp. ATCC 35208]OMP79652.1 hypothetical protein BW716_08760 [[Flexibacter] sp. ATCC 35208]